MTQRRYVRRGSRHFPGPITSIRQAFKHAKADTVKVKNLERYLNSSRTK